MAAKKFEVEQKFMVADLCAVESALAELPHERLAAVEQLDLYFAHPARDFSLTDEALRIRRVGESNFVTYKGPKIDAATKTRREIELPLSPGEEGADEFQELLMALSFRPVAEVRKYRHVLLVQWEGHQIEVALDEITGLGAFVELELPADESELDDARAAIAALAAHLGFSQAERRSYLELLLEAKKGGEQTGD